MRQATSLLCSCFLRPLRVVVAADVYEAVCTAACPMRQACFLPTGALGTSCMHWECDDASQAGAISS